MGQMGPSAPDTGASMRFFTFAFDEDGNVTEVSYKLSAISKQDAEEWARSLLGKREVGRERRIDISFMQETARRL